MVKQPAVMVAAICSAACGTQRTAVEDAAQLLGDVDVRTVEMSELDDERSRCENLTRPGSRIVVAQRCRPIDEEALADQLRQVSREQEELDRLARERQRGAGL